QVLGEVGNGWAQNIGELAFERGGPDRFLSTFPVLELWLREYGAQALGERGTLLLGRATATLWGLRQLSLASARAIDGGRSPVVEAALVKEMGTRFEQELIEALLDVTDLEPSPDAASAFERLLCEAILTGPAFTIRGGTIEVLRSIVAKGLGS
ncbi:MAG: acyl-CoA dehydrogenase domain protein, partial [Frankiales bacterium]|nr:acyl-CoA dehydrogenase domain protein [Frankiales bacterium]